MERQDRIANEMRTVAHRQHGFHELVATGHRHVVECPASTFLDTFGLG